MSLIVKQQATTQNIAKQCKTMIDIVKQTTEHLKTSVKLWNGLSISFEAKFS